MLNDGSDSADRSGSSGDGRGVKTASPCWRGGEGRGMFLATKFLLYWVEESVESTGETVSWKSAGLSSWLLFEGRVSGSSGVGGDWDSFVLCMLFLWLVSEACLAVA